MKTLEDFSFSNRSSTRGKHDWAKLLNGSIWSVESGVDFTSKPAIFLAQARMQAKKRGGKIRTQTTADAVVMQFYREDQPHVMAAPEQTTPEPSAHEVREGVPKKPAKAKRAS